MKQHLLTLLLALAASVAPLFAQSGTCGTNITWTLSNGILTISGTGAMKDYTLPDNVPWYSYRESIKTVIIEDGVTSIGDDAFLGCSSLTSVTIPNSVTSIGNYAFSTCSSLTSVTIPNSVTSIGDGAFSTCSKLTSVTIPNSVTSIGDYAFNNCSSLTSVTIPNSVTYIGSSAFAGCSSLPVIDNIRYADTYLVGAVDKTKSTYTIKEGTKWIGDDAFKYCSSLTSVTIPNSVTSIGSEAFHGCTSLTSVTIPNSVTSIGSHAFESCRKLTSVTIPNSVTTIGNYAFSWCTSLTSITVNSKNPNYCDIDGVLFNKNKTTLIRYPEGKSATSYIIPNSVTSIGYAAFSNCSNLTSVTIPNSVTRIGSLAFSGCSKLTSVTIPNSVTSIGDHAFNNCSSLTSITIPSSVTSIGEKAFQFCRSLTSVTCEAVAPPTLVEYDVFYTVDRSIPLYVPAQSIDLYKAAYQWKDFTNILPITSSTPETFTITFLNYDGSELQSSEVEAGTMPQYNGTDPTKPADAQYTYTFAGWNDGNNTYKPQDELPAVTSDVTYTATFEAASIEDYADIPMEQNTTEGTRFFAVFPRITGTKMNDITLQMRVVVTAKEKVSITLRSVEGQIGNVMEKKTLNAGETWVSKPIAWNLGYMYDDDVVTKRGVHIYSDDGKTPFSCFLLHRAGPLGNSARDASVLIPYEAYGREYIVHTFPNEGKSTQFLIFAPEDNTTVRIIPSAPTSTGGTAGVPFERTMHQRTSLLISSKQKLKGTGDTLDMSGSIICANKPIAVFEANEAVNIPLSEIYSNDFTIEQLPPVRSFGSEFYVSRPGEHIRNMEATVTALYDNTNVTEIRYNAETGKTSTVTNTLSARQSLAVRPTLTDKITDIVIKTSQPALCFNYMTSSGYNSEDVYDENGNLKVTYHWGDPANAMMVPWDHRVKRMTFFARPLETISEDALQFHYVQVNVPKKDIGLLLLDGVTVNSSLFKTYGGDANMAYATIPVTAGENIGHELTTTGDGFTGYVCGISQAGTGYMYTLGYRLDLLTDSLYITDTKNYMSEYSYDLERMKTGWYQRQFRDFPPNKLRLDTAVICDKTTLNFAVDCDHTFDSVIWQVDKLTKNGAVERIVVRENFPFAKLHKWKHQFEVDLDKDLEASKRDPYTNYKVQALLCHQRVLCSEDMPIYDTLKTIVRVMRSYDDTIPRVVCAGDETTFFSDKSHVETINSNNIPQESDLGKPAERKPTVFIADASAKGEVKVDDFTYRIGLGKHYFKRKYQMKFGCDSIVTFAVFVESIPAPQQLSDRVLTHSNPTIKFNGGENTFFNGKTISKPGIYTDHLKTVGRHSGEIVDPEFDGCDSVVTLRVHLRDTLTASFCDRTDNPELYGVDWKDFVWTGHTKTNPNVASQVAVGETKKFEDYGYTNKDGLDSCYVLYLTRDPVTVKTYEFTIPNGFAYTWEYGDGDITRTKEIPPGQNETKTFNERINYENGCPMLFHLTLTWIEMDAKIEERSVCLNDTIMYRGKIFAGADWKDTYPNASFTPFETRGLGKWDIKMGTVENQNTTEYVLSLTVLPTHRAEIVVDFSEEDVMEECGVIYGGAKATKPYDVLIDHDQTITCSYTGSNGCDSIVVKHIRVRSSNIAFQENESSDYYTQFANDYNGVTVTTATLNRQFTQGKWATLCLPFDVNKALMTALGLYNRVFEFRYAQQLDDETIQMYFAPAQTLEAGKGYIVNANSKLAQKTSFVFPNVTIDTDADNGDITTLTGYNDGTGRGSLYLVGTLRTGILQGSTTGNTWLGLKDNQLYYPNTTSGTSIRAYRGFFRSDIPVNAQRVRIIADGESVTELEVTVDEQGRMDNVHLQNNATSAHKYIENGILYIRRNGTTYNAQGQVIIVN